MHIHPYKTLARMRSKVNNGWRDPQDHDDDQAAFYPDSLNLFTHAPVTRRTMSRPGHWPIR